MGMFRWTMPMPPCCASAMARCDSVTVSMAALTIGMFNAMVRVRQVRVSVWAGRTSLREGTSSTSSNVSPSSIVSGIIRCTSHDSERPLFLAAGRFRADHFRLLDRAELDLLALVGAAADFEGRQLDALTRTHGLQERLDDANIGHAFAPVRLRLFVAQNAIRKIQQLGAELVVLRELLVRFAAVLSHPHFDGVVILVTRAHAEAAFRTDDVIGVDGGGAEAACELRETVAGEAHDGGGHLVNFVEARLAVAGSEGG